VVIDVFSCMPLAANVFLAEPGADAMAGLLQQAIRSNGTPRHFVSDQGAQFTAEAFRTGLTKLGIRQRFGAIGKTGSIAIVERLWRTLKETLSLRALRPLTRQDLESSMRTCVTTTLWTSATTRIAPIQATSSRAQWPGIGER
jgi:transposase InsO family protein